MPRPLELEDLELVQLEAAFRSGRWLADDGPFDVSVDAAKTDDKQVAFNLALKKGLLKATVFVDRAIWLPKMITRRGGFCSMKGRVKDKLLPYWQQGLYL